MSYGYSSISGFRGNAREHGFLEELLIILKVKAYWLGGFFLNLSADSGLGFA